MFFDLQVKDTLATRIQTEERKLLVKLVDAFTMLLILRLDGSKELLLSCSKMFFDMIQSLLCLIHNSGLPLNVKQHNAVIKYYLEAVGENDPYVELGSYVVHKYMVFVFKRLYLGGSKVTFVGCQPESLHERHLPMLVKEPYFVTSKTDGDRFQLIAIPVILVV